MWGVLKYFLAGILLFSGLAKSNEIIGNPIWTDAILLPPFLHVFFTCLEFVVAFSLIFETSKLLSWFTAAFFFGLLTMASGFLAISGSKHCGCFGQWIEVSPALVFLFDGVLLALIAAAFRDVRGHQNDEAMRLRLDGGYFGTQFALVSLCAAAATFYGTEYGKTRNPFLDENHRMIRVVEDVDVGNGEPGDRVEAQFSIENRSAYPARIVSRGRSCKCIKIGELPTEIGPREQVTVPISYEFLDGDVDKAVTKRFVIFLDHPSQFSLIGSVVVNGGRTLAAD